MRHASREKWSFRSAPFARCLANPACDDFSQHGHPKKRGALRCKRADLAVSTLDMRSANAHTRGVRSSANTQPVRRPEDVPAYSFGEAAMLAGVPVSTLRAWIVGRASRARRGGRGSQAIVRLPKGERQYLTFTNLVEVHVLAAMRRKHALSLEVIRRAVRYVHEQLEIEHPLASEQFKTNGVDLFVERLGKNHPTRAARASLG